MTGEPWPIRPLAHRPRGQEDRSLTRLGRLAGRELVPGDPGALLRGPEATRAPRREPDRARAPGGRMPGDFALHDVDPRGRLLLERRVAPLQRGRPASGRVAGARPVVAGRHSSGRTSRPTAVSFSWWSTGGPPARDACTCGRRTARPAVRLGEEPGRRPVAGRPLGPRPPGRTGMLGPPRARPHRVRASGASCETVPCRVLRRRRLVSGREAHRGRGRRERQRAGGSSSGTSR